MAGPQQPPHCMFFELSAELRNIIYEYVLPPPLSTKEPYERNEIILRPDTGLQVPAILQTCRQISKEAGSIYFEQNWFNLWLRDCDPEFLLVWQAMAVRHVGSSTHHISVPDCEFYYNCGKEDYQNIIKWCKLVYDDELPLWDATREECNIGVASPVLICGHRLAVQFRSKPWDEFLDTFNTLDDAVSMALEAAHY